MRLLIVLALLAGLLGMHGLLSDHHAGMAGMSTVAAVDHAAHRTVPADPAPTVDSATGMTVACCLAVLAVGLRALLRRPDDGVARPAPPRAGPPLSPVTAAVRLLRPPDLADLQVLRL